MMGNIFANFSKKKNNLRPPHGMSPIVPVSENAWSIHILPGQSQTEFQSLFPKYLFIPVVGPI